jgi:hypothetical protein
MQHCIHAAQTFPHGVAIADRRDVIRVRRRQQVDAARSMAEGPERAHESFAEMASASGD